MPLSVSITDADIADAETCFGCSFSDEKRREVLKCNTSIDIQGGPGSGKTRLLVAKAAILASKWTWRSRGICVLSHTNVARQEVERRLSRHPTGYSLLGYPHFIGTIQAFVDQFLALPYLRGEGIELSRIDDEWFGNRAMGLGSRSRLVQSLLRNKPKDGPATVSSLRFEGGGLALGSGDGKLPSERTATHIELRKLKGDLLQRGVCRYDDMFAFAEAYLSECLPVEKALRFRFPWVFIDEMQDTNSVQDALITKLFSEGCVLERFGDINQAIFGDDGAEGETVSFPKQGYIEIADSLRFGHEIAALSSCLTAVAPQQLAGRDDMPLRRHTIFVFDGSSIHQVIPAFGDLLLQESPESIPKEFAVKAAGFRKKPPEDAHHLPHAISDYWPGFRPDLVSKSSRPGQFVDYVRRARDSQLARGECTESYAILIDGVLQLLLIQGARTDEGKHFTKTRLIDELSRSEKLSRFQVLMLHLCVDDQALIAERWPSIVDNLVDATSQSLKGKLSPDSLTFLRWVDDLSGTAQTSTTTKCSRQNVFPHKGLDIEVNTIHGVKGETHAATLVLETFWKGKHDLQNLLPYLKNGRGTEPLGKNLREQMKRVFVGMTRPRELLCLAIHGDHLQEGDPEALRSRGWHIQDFRD